MTGDARAVPAEPWDCDPRRSQSDGELRLDLDGFEGPIDVLLGLARDQKVDLARLSIRALADQYLAFVARARHLKLELAAEYLVMAAWLAYLKSRLLLPDPPGDDEPSGAELEARLILQLQRIEALRRCAHLLLQRIVVGRDVFFRGAPEPVEIERTPVYDLSLYRLLKAYADHDRRTQTQPYRVVPTALHTVEAAVARLSRWLGGPASWATLASFLPDDLADDVVARSAVAATLLAGLELAKQGRLTMRQDQPFGPIWFRAAAATPAVGAEPEAGSEPQ